MCEGGIKTNEFYPAGTAPTDSEIPGSATDFIVVTLKIIVIGKEAEPKEIPSLPGKLLSTQMRMGEWGLDEEIPECLNLHKTTRHVYK